MHEASSPLISLCLPCSQCYLPPSYFAVPSHTRSHSAPLSRQDDLQSQIIHTHGVSNPRFKFDILRQCCTCSSVPHFLLRCKRMALLTSDLEPTLFARQDSPTNSPITFDVLPTPSLQIVTITETVVGPSVVTVAGTDFIEPGGRTTVLLLAAPT